MLKRWLWRNSTFLGVACALIVATAPLRFAWTVLHSRFADPQSLIGGSGEPSGAIEAMTWGLFTFGLVAAGLLVLELVGLIRRHSRGGPVVVAQVTALKTLWPSLWLLGGAAVGSWLFYAPPWFAGSSRELAEAELAPGQSLELLIVVPWALLVLGPSLLACGACYQRRGWKMHRAMAIDLLGLASLFVISVVWLFVVLLPSTGPLSASEQEQLRGVAAGFAMHFAIFSSTLALAWRDIAPLWRPRDLDVLNLWSGQVAEHLEELNKLEDPFTTVTSSFDYAGDQSVTNEKIWDVDVSLCFIGEQASAIWLEREIRFALKRPGVRLHLFTAEGQESEHFEALRTLVFDQTTLHPRIMTTPENALAQAREILHFERKRLEAEWTNQPVAYEPFESQRIGNAAVGPLLAAHTDYGVIFGWGHLSHDGSANAQLTLAAREWASATHHPLIAQAAFLEGLTAGAALPVPAIIAGHTAQTYATTADFAKALGRFLRIDDRHTRPRLTVFAAAPQRNEAVSELAALGFDVEIAEVAAPPGRSGWWQPRDAQFQVHSERAYRLAKIARSLLPGLAALAASTQNSTIADQEMVLRLPEESIRATSEDDDDDPGQSLAS